MFEKSRQGAVDIVQGSESLTVDVVEQIESLIDEILADGVPRVVIDLNGPPLIDSRGLEKLIETKQRCEQRGGDVKLAMPNPLCRDILAVTGVERMFEIHDDISAAVRSFIA